MNVNYKDTFIYRVIKVSTVMFIINGVIFFIIIGYLNIPHDYTYFIGNQRFHGTEGRWSDVLGIWLFGIVSVYSVGHLARETLLYLFFGKPYNWAWIKDLQL